MSRQFEKRDKKVQKMSKDGLVEKNLVTGEEQRISQRGQDFQLRRDSPPQGAGEALRPVSPGRTGRGQRSAAYSEVPAQSADTSNPEASRFDGDSRTPESFRQDGESHTPDASPASAPEIRRDTRYGEPGTAPRTDSPHRHNQRRQSMADNSYRPEAAGDFPKQPEPMRSPEYPPYDTPPNTQTTDDPRQVTDSDATASEAPPRTAGPERPGRLRYSDGATPPPSKRKPRQHGTAYQRKFAPDAAKPDNAASEAPKPSAPDTPPPDTPRRPGQSSRLQFTSDERSPGSDGGPLPDKKLSKLQGKAEKLDNRLERARDKLPSKKKLRRALVYDEQKQKVKRKIQFEKPANKKSIAK